MFDETDDAQWETLEQCSRNYCKLVERYITCGGFGACDGMNGNCVWCSEMTPYQWWMCSDHGWKESLKKEPPFGRGFTEVQAINFIQDYKSKIKR